MAKTIFHNNTPIILDKQGFNSFEKAFKNVQAGGGLVRNDEEKFLLIFRKGHWDLPKGKMDTGETMETCALREVQEETGVSDLRIIRKLPKTYHLYADVNGEIILKKCFWFEMKTSENNPLKPQLEEEITQAVWLSRDEIESLKPLMFPSIQQCLEEYFLPPKRFHFFRRRH